MAKKSWEKRLSGKPNEQMMDFVELILGQMTPGWYAAAEVHPGGRYEQ